MAKIEVMQFRLGVKEREKVVHLMNKRGYTKISDFMRHLLDKELERETHITDLEYTLFRVSRVIEALKK